MFGNRKSVQEKSIQDSKTNRAKGVLDSLIDNTAIVSSKQWGISIVKSENNNHVFLVLEGVEDNKEVFFRFDFFLDLNTQKSISGAQIQRGSLLNSLLNWSASSGGRGFVCPKVITAETCYLMSQTCEFVRLGIDPDEAEKLLLRLRQDVDKKFTYHIAGDSPLYSSSYASVKTENCVSWAQSIINETLKKPIGSKWAPIKTSDYLLKRAKELENLEQVSSAEHSNN